MSGTSESLRSIGLRRGLAGYLIGAALLTLALVALLAVLAGRNSHHAKGVARELTSGEGSASSTSHAPGVVDPSAPPAGTPSARVNVAEVRDPEEARSFPASPSVHHKAAATPTTAAQEEFHPSPGAASNAEVKRELHVEERAQAEERSRTRQPLTPVAGGESIGGSGALPIPGGVPEVVQKVVAGANAIADFPYVFGGGHASFVDNAYDCSGSVSYALAAGGLLGAPETSGELESWGAPGPGRYITVYANAGHTYMYVDGVLYDTAGRSGVYASRWQVGAVDNAGYVARHWPGL